MELKTVKEWENIFDTFVFDSDGFPVGTIRNETLFTERDFLTNCEKSTIIMSERILKAMNNRRLPNNQ